MLSRKQSAISHNVIFNMLSLVFLVAWHFLDMKSMLGTVIDSIPNIVCSVYILRSKRVRRTFDEVRSAPAWVAADPRMRN